MDTAEKMAADIALTMNGGEWKDGKWYSKGHREAWIKAVQPYADEIERLQKGFVWLDDTIEGHLLLNPENKDSKLIQEIKRKISFILSDGGE